MKKILTMLTVCLSTVLIAMGAETQFWADGLLFEIESEEDASVNLTGPDTTTASEAYLEGVTKVIVPSTVINQATGKEYIVVGVLQDAFSNLDALEEITFSEGIRLIHGVTNLPNLKTVTLPETLEHLRGFNDLPQLTALKLPDGLKEIGYMSLNSVAVENLIIPEGVTLIDGATLSDCDNLKSLDLKGIISIADHSVYLPNLKKLRMPPSFRYSFFVCIGGGMDEVWFMSDGEERSWEVSLLSFTCRPASVYCQRTTPPSFTMQDAFESNENEGRHSDNMFGGLENMKSIKLYVPRGCAEVYRNTPYWGTMQIQEYDFEADLPLVTPDRDAARGNGHLYDLLGRRVTDAIPAPGIYVCDGKKVLMH